MKCDEFESRLDEILDERRLPEWDEQLRQHSAGCRHCRDLASAYAVLLEGLRTGPSVPCPADLPERVLESYQARPRLATAAALAAAVFSTAAAVLVAFYVARDGKETKSVAHLPSAPAIRVQRLDEMEFDLERWKNVPLLGAVFASAADKDDSTDPYEALAKETGRSLANVVLLMPGVAGPSGVRPLTTNMYGPEGSGVWPAQMSDELRPVSRSVSETFNLLLDTLPLTFRSTPRTRAS